VTAGPVGLQGASQDTCGFSGRADADNCGVFRDIAYTRISETPYIQPCYFGAGVAFHWRGAMRSQPLPPVAPSSDGVEKSDSILPGHRLSAPPAFFCAESTKSVFAHISERERRRG